MEPANFVSKKSRRVTEVPNIALKSRRVYALRKDPTIFVFVSDRPLDRRPVTPR